MNVFHGETTACKPKYTLRYILTSRIIGVIPEDHFDLDYGISILSGCPNNPSLPQPTDEEVFAMCHRHSDFDRYALAYSPNAIPQFLRWKERMRLRETKGMEGSVLTATSWGFSRWRTTSLPRYALEPLPEATQAHLTATRRTVYPEFLEALQNSNQFTIVLEEELSPASGTRFARTFVCRLLRVDFQEITVPFPSKLCVKIYDDGIGKVGSVDSGQSGLGWLRDFYTEKEMLQNEENIYMRLRHAWGSTLPFYYGAHLVSTDH